MDAPSSAAFARRLAVPLLVGLALIPAHFGHAQDIGLNRTIETLEFGQPVFGLATGTFDLTNARSLATSDLDFIIIDMEHSPFDIETARTFLLGMVDIGRAVQKGSTQMDVTPILRIPMNGRENLQFLVKQALDMGAYGVMFPFINTADEALNAVASMRYPQPRGDAQPEPRGTRGSSPGNARWIWGARDYTQRADVWPLDPRGELLAFALALWCRTRGGVHAIIAASAPRGAPTQPALDLARSASSSDILCGIVRVDRGRWAAPSR